MTDNKLVDTDVLHSQRIATVEPVFANIRHTKRLDHARGRTGRQALARSLGGVRMPRKSKITERGGGISHD